MNTYKHGDKWLTEIRVDPNTTISRPATEAEIASASAPVEVSPIGETIEAADESDTIAGEPKRRGRPPKVRE